MTDPIDNIKRLREWDELVRSRPSARASVYAEAADEIERLMRALDDITYILAGVDTIYTKGDALHAIGTHEEVMKAFDRNLDRES